MTFEKALLDTTLYSEFYKDWLELRKYMGIKTRGSDKKCREFMERAFLFGSVCGARSKGDMKTTEESIRRDFDDKVFETIVFEDNIMYSLLNMFDILYFTMDAIE